MNFNWKKGSPKTNILEVRTNLVFNKIHSLFTQDIYYYPLLEYN